MPSETGSRPLFSSLEMGDVELPNRIVMAPLTRSRSIPPGNTQTALHALYYAQRATAGFIVTEATQISSEGQGYAWTPGIHSDEQVEHWRLVTDAVHNAGGRIFCQLWHVGAISHNVFQPEGKAPLSSSSWQPEGQSFVGDLLPEGPLVPTPEARAMTSEDIERTLANYQKAARCAKRAGFDGVELHAANGYLIDQFIRSSVNKREDEYGGPVENRLRFLTRALDALLAELPAGRIGVRLSPTDGPGGSYDDDPEGTYVAAAKALSGRGLAYLHVVRPNDHTGEGENLERGIEILGHMRDAFSGVFIANGEISPEEGEKWIEKGKADAIAFGRHFLANPDLPARIAAGGPYNDPDPDTFYGGGAEGYVDYPSLAKVEPAY